METILSIIISAYNAEKTISCCLDSLADHIDHATEIIVVDDGSQDRTAEICQSYIRNGYRMKLFRQANAGISAARNLALQHAQGKYFTIVDADDYVSSDFCRILAQSLYFGEYDVLWFGTNQTTQYIPYKTSVDVTPTDLSAEQLAQMKSVPLYYDHKLNQQGSSLLGISPSTAWGSVFRRQLQVENLILYSDTVLMYEDGIYNLNMLHYCQKAGFVPQALYQYMFNPESATNRFRTDWQEKFAVRNTEAQRLVRDVIGIPLDDTTSSYVQRYYGSILFQLKIILESQIFSRRNPDPISEQIRQCRSLLTDPLYRQCLDKCDQTWINPGEKHMLTHLRKNNAVYTWSYYEYRYWRHQAKLWLMSLRRK